VRVIGLVGLAVLLASAQYWTGPHQLSSYTGSDVNPSVCKEWVQGSMTCLVWQSMRPECWNIYSRFCNFYNGNGWGAEQAVTRDSVTDNVNPVVAACNDWTDHPSFWCAWERRDSRVAGSIWVAFHTLRDEWFPPVQIGRTIHNAGDSAEPSMIVIQGESVDTAWVIWRNWDTGGASISYCYHDGDSWSEPGIVAYSGGGMHHARLGRGCGSRNQWHPYPLVTWEQDGDIYYSEYIGGAWSAPAQVAPSAATDLNPDVVSFGGYFTDYTSRIVWQSDRDGDTAIYGTKGDTFSLCDRWCDTAGAGRNWAPAGSPAAFTVDPPWWELVAVWVSDRSGNPDIFSRCAFYPWDDAYVDSSPAVDGSPAVTVMGLTQVWCIWQSNRTGNWDIFGSFLYSVGMEESRQPTAGVSRPAATVVVGVLSLQVDSRQHTAYRAELLDISGRKVLDLHPGANDVSRLAPGVYFVRGPSTAGVQRVILAR